MLWEETTEVGREQIMKEILNKQANKLFTFDFKYYEKQTNKQNPKQTNKKWVVAVEMVRSDWISHIF